MHYSLYFVLLIIIASVNFSQLKVPKPVPQKVAKPECSLTSRDTECMSSLEIYVSLKPEAIKIFRLCVFLIVIFCCCCFLVASLAESSAVYSHTFD